MNVHAWPQFVNSTGFYQRPSTRSSNIRVYSEHKKDNVNDGLALEKVSGCSTNKVKQFKALVLDGPEMQTSRTLIAHGFMPENILIANNNSRDHDAILKRITQDDSLNKVHLSNKALEDCVAITEKFYVDFLFADFMATYNGSVKGCKPKSDIEKIFELNVLKEDAVFATTLSSRNNKNGSIGNAEIEKDIIAIAKKYGYKLETIKLPALVSSYTYRKQGVDIQVFNRMYVFTFKVAAIGPPSSYTSVDTRSTSAPAGPSPLVCSPCNRPTLKGTACKRKTRGGVACHHHK